MFTGRCLHTNKDDSQCKRDSTIATWTFQFEGEEFDTPTWVETCAWHQPMPYVASMDISRKSHA